MTSPQTLRSQLLDMLEDIDHGLQHISDDSQAPEQTTASPQPDSDAPSITNKQPSQDRD
jgi:hypothetical protein